MAGTTVSEACGANATSKAASSYFYPGSAACLCSCLLNKRLNFLEKKFDQKNEIMNEKLALSIKEIVLNCSEENFFFSLLFLSFFSFNHARGHAEFSLPALDCIYAPCIANTEF